VEAEKLGLNRKGNDAAVASEYVVWCGVWLVCGELPQCVVNCCGWSVVCVWRATTVCGKLLWCIVSWVNCSVQYIQDSDLIGTGAS